jgi:DNA-binding transcriptional MerR regulator
MRSPEPEMGSGAQDVGARPVYSIGAVAKMVGVEPATLRSWEERYAAVIPARSGGSQRVYSRDQVEQLRFIADRVTEGASAADAHRLLAERLGMPSSTSAVGDEAVVIVILLAERDRYAAQLCEYFLRTEGYDVCLALDPHKAEDLYVQRRPNLSIVELMIAGGGFGLCERLTRDEGVPLLAVSALALRDEALAAGASAFLEKPFEPLEFVSTVRDLLGASALTRRDPTLVS